MRKKYADFNTLTCRLVILQEWNQDSRCKVTAWYEPHRTSRTKTSGRIVINLPRLKKCVSKDETIKWYTYFRKSMGVHADGITIDLESYLFCCFIHEYTHHWQHINGKRFGEVQTSLNEISWMRQNRPEYASQLTKVAVRKVAKKH